MCVRSSGIHRRIAPTLLPDSVSIIGGLLYVFNSKYKDEEIAYACAEYLIKIVEHQSTHIPHTHPRASIMGTNITTHKNSTYGVPQIIKRVKEKEVTNLPTIDSVLTMADYRDVEGRTWEVQAVSLVTRALDFICLRPTTTSSITSSETSTSTSNVRATSGSRKAKHLSKKEKGKAKAKETEKEVEIVVRAMNETHLEQEKSKNDKIEDEVHCNTDENNNQEVSGGGVLNKQSQKKGILCWTKYTLLSVISLLALVEVISVLPDMINMKVLFQDVRGVLRTLLSLLPVKCADVARRIELYLSRHQDVVTAVVTVVEDGITSLPTLHSLPSSSPSSNPLPTPYSSSASTTLPLFPTLSCKESSTSTSLPSKEDSLHVEEGSSVAEECSLKQVADTPSGKMFPYQEDPFYQLLQCGLVKSHIHTNTRTHR